MNQAVLADTGPLYAAVDPDDDYHIRAVAEQEQLERESLLVAVPHPVLLECYTLVLRRLGVHTAHRWLSEAIEGAVLVAATADDLIEAARTVRMFRDQPITLVDAAVAQLSVRLGIPAWTYDHHFDHMRVPVWRS